jgi:hypothetical protein
MASATIGMPSLAKLFQIPVTRTAHNPLDIICGAALGVTIGSCLNLAGGVPGRSVDTVRPGVLPAA